MTKLLLQNILKKIQLISKIWIKHKQWFKTDFLQNEIPLLLTII